VRRYRLLEIVTLRTSPTQDLEPQPPNVEKFQAPEPPVG